MVEGNSAPERPVPLSSSPNLGGTPRLQSPGEQSQKPPLADTAAESSGPGADSIAPPPPARASGEFSFRPARERRPGEIPLRARARLSLARLFKLEQEIGQLPGVRDPQVKVLDDGQIVVQVTPDVEVRVREFLILAGELTERSASGE